VQNKPVLSLLTRAGVLAAFLNITPAPLSLAIFDTNRPETHQNILDHFKYGSIGAEQRTGIPYLVWLALPRAFPQHLPAKAGNGYERFGFVFEGGKKRPIGTSYRERQVPLIGLNCAACHTGTLRDSPGGQRRIVLGMPSHQIDLQAYQRFLFACFRDPAFDSDYVWNAMKQETPGLSWFDGIRYRWFVIPETRKVGRQLAAESAWTETRPPAGPGRVDTFNPYKVMFGFNMSLDHSVGTADLPPIWNQKLRDHMWLHWDGNNDLVTERNKSAAIGAGCSEDSLDLASMKRVEDWIWTLPAPAFPKDKIDHERAAAGAALYGKLCADCHSPGGKRTGTTIPLAEIAADPERLNSFTPELAARMNTIGAGRPWKFTRFRKTGGYAAMPLDGVWLRAPYLHNGSVPTLRLLLEKPVARPAVFWRGYDTYDYENVGFVWSGPAAERLGFRFDTALPGNGRGGHLYGTDLNPAEKDHLLEYLKTL
jgi:mono/diheme cytochrome c family protein